MDTILLLMSTVKTETVQGGHKKIEGLSAKKALFIMYNNKVKKTRSKKTRHIYLINKVKEFEVLSPLNKGNSVISHTVYDHYLRK